MAPKFRFGDEALCPECQNPFPLQHGRQKFCSYACQRAAKSARPRKKVDRTTYNQKWLEKNKDRVKQKRREYYETNKAVLLAKQKSYLQMIPPEEMRARRQRWAAAHKAREIKRYHATRAWLPWLNAFRGSKQRAKKHSVPFTITKEWCSERWTGRCEVTGIEFILSTKRSPYLFSPSLDRIIPTLGYTPDNTRFVLHAVNALKGQGTDSDMLAIATAIVQKAGDPMLYTQAPETDLAVTTS